MIHEMQRDRAKRRLTFVCVGNSCRSQMAEGFAKQFAQKLNVKIEIMSGGTRPQGYVHPEAIKVMAERGIDISQQESKRYDSSQLTDGDVVISMGCTDKSICPSGFSGLFEDWGIQDPFDMPLDVYRQSRDQIEKRVKALIDRLAQEAA